MKSNVSSAKIEPKDGSVGAASSSIPQSSPIQLTEKSKSDTNSDQTTTICSSQPASSLSKESNGIIGKPPKPQNQDQKAASLAHMPCVSTTGNGPNGKTITGFLYKYSRSEVSIICVCHGSSFSPAEFVEHAGGIDISHPLKHITVVPSAFGWQVKASNSSIKYFFWFLLLLAEIVEVSNLNVEKYDEFWTSLKSNYNVTMLHTKYLRYRHIFKSGQWSKPTNAILICQ